MTLMLGYLALKLVLVRASKKPLDSSMFQLTLGNNNIQ